MTYDVLGPRALDYLPCRYGTSKLEFRGPKRALEGPYVAFIGGTQTFGKFIEQPFPLRVEHLTGVTSVNFGQMDAGIDVFLRDPVVLKAAQDARVTVVEVLGAAHLNNPFYKVHSRRNDRFLGPSGELKNLYPDVDFTEFSFIHHMLRHLHHTDPHRFSQVKERLQKMWRRRMKRLLARLGERVVLVRFRSAAQEGEWAAQTGNGPAFVTDGMIGDVCDNVAAVVAVQATSDIDEDGLVFDPSEEAAARAVIGPSSHQAAADSLRRVLDDLM